MTPPERLLKTGTANPDRHCNSGETRLCAEDGTDSVGIVRKETGATSCRSGRKCKSLVSVVASHKDDNDNRLAELQYLWRHRWILVGPCCPLASCARARSWRRRQSTSSRRRSRGNAPPLPSFLMKFQAAHRESAGLGCAAADGRDVESPVRTNSHPQMSCRYRPPRATRTYRSIPSIWRSWWMCITSWSSLKRLSVTCMQR